MSFSRNNEFIENIGKNNLYASDKNVSDVKYTISYHVYMKICHIPFSIRVVKYDG